MDNDASRGGDNTHDLLNDHFFQSLIRRCSRGEFLAIVAAPPCSTFSISRFIGTEDPTIGAPVVRTREHIYGVPNLDQRHERELRESNELVRRMCTLLHIAHAAGSEFLIENPIDRGHASFKGAYANPKHGPIWVMPELLTLSQVTECSSVNFSQCRYGASVRKDTTFMFTPGLSPTISQLSIMSCNHKDHSVAAGGMKDVDGRWNSTDHSAFPAALNYFLAQALVTLARQHKPIETSSKLGLTPPIVQSNMTGESNDLVSTPVESLAPKGPTRQEVVTPNSEPTHDPIVPPPEPTSELEAEHPELASNDDEYDITDDPLAREVEMRLEGATMCYRLL